MPGPLGLIGGGSGMVPLMSMLRHHMNHLDADKERNITFLTSARTSDHILYHDEIQVIAARDPHVNPYTP